MPADLPCSGEAGSGGAILAEFLVVSLVLEGIRLFVDIDILGGPVPRKPLNCRQ